MLMDLSKVYDLLAHNLFEIRGKKTNFYLGLLNINKEFKQVPLIAIRLNFREYYKTKY